MKEKIASFTRQLRDALQMGDAFAFGRSPAGIQHIAIAGMGGSGIGANLVSAALHDQLSVPVSIFKSYGVPACVGPSSLFIASSYSGETEETLDALEAAQHRKAQLVCITSGGAMAKLAKEQKLDLLRLPAGSSSPRAMVGYGMLALLYVLHKAGLIDGQFVDQTQHAIDLLDREEEIIRLQAKELAAALRGKIPIIYGDHRTEALAIRFQNQLNENSKCFAHVNFFPEMNHNEIVGIDHPSVVCRQMQVLYLQAEPMHPRIVRRMEICRDMLGQKTGRPVIDLPARGESLLEQFFFLIHFTDWTSYFLAEALGEDADTIQPIHYLKEQLSHSL